MGIKGVRHSGVQQCEIDWDIRKTKIEVRWQHIFPIFLGIEVSQTLVNLVGLNFKKIVGDSWRFEEGSGSRDLL